MAQYFSDYDDFLPATNGTSPYLRWQDYLYVLNTPGISLVQRAYCTGKAETGNLRPRDVFACPAQRKFGELHYAVNNFITLLPNRTVKKVKMPSRRYFIMEHNYESGGQATNWYVLFDRIDFIRHNGRSNILFLAGNTGSFSKSAVPSNHKTYEWGQNYDD